MSIPVTGLSAQLPTIIDTSSDFGRNAVEKIRNNSDLIIVIIPLAEKIFEAFAHCIASNSGKIVSIVKNGVLDTLGIYSLFQYMKFFRNSFSKENLDKNKLRDSICELVKKNFLNKLTSTKNIDTDIFKKNVSERTELIFKKVMEDKKCKSEKDILNSIKCTITAYKLDVNIEEEGFDEKIVIEKKKRSLVKIMSIACYSLAVGGGILVSLKNWGIVDLGKAALSIGNQCPIFMFFLNAGAEAILGVVTSAGIILALGDAAQRIITNVLRYSRAENQEQKDDAYHRLVDSLFDLLVSGTNLASALAPLAFTLNPPIVLALAIIAKGTGVIVMLIRDRVNKEPLILDLSIKQKEPTKNPFEVDVRKRPRSTPLNLRKRTKTRKRDTESPKSELSNITLRASEGKNVRNEDATTGKTRKKASLRGTESIESSFSDSQGLSESSLPESEVLDS